MKSNIVLLLHSHIPYVKRQGRWPFGEVWLFEAMAETYIPFLQAWYRLIEDGICPQVTVSFSPTLLEQLSSKYIQKEFVNYLKERESKALEEERYYNSISDKKMAELAAYYYRFYKDVRRDYCIEYDCDIIQGMKDLKDKGFIEIITTSASHAYLPLLDKKSLEYQVLWGKKAYEKYFVSEPAGFWLPECGYFQGIEDILIKNGFKYFFVDSHAVEGGKPLGDFSYGCENEGEVEIFADTGLSTYRPYRIKNKDIMVLGRNAMVSQQVWSADYGYPGDVSYREFHKQSYRSGFKYWRVTDRYNTMDKKELYNSNRASQRVKQHAIHFKNSLENTGIEARNLGFDSPLIVACYDTELFGHWWWEGINWLEELMKQIHTSSGLELVLPSTIKDVAHEAQVFESSWGMGGKHYVWDNEETAWMWDVIKQASQEYHGLDKEDIRSDIGGRVLAQALRELILIESSDWLFMVSNNLTRDYAMKRFYEHYAKFLRLTYAIRENNFNDELVEWLDRIQLEDDFLLNL